MSNIKRQNRRPDLVRRLGEVIAKDFLCKKTSDCKDYYGEEYENIKTTLRSQMNEFQIQTLAIAAAIAVVEANHLCNVTAIRDANTIKHRPSIKTRR